MTLLSSSSRAESGPRYAGADRILPRSLRIGKDRTISYLFELVSRLAFVLLLFTIQGKSVMNKRRSPISESRAMHCVYNVQTLKPILPRSC